MIRKSMIVAASLALVLGACGGDDDSDAQAEIAEQLAAAPDGDELSEEQTDCFAGALIEELGETEARSFAEDPDAWTGQQVDAAVAAGGDDETDEMRSLGAAFEECGIEA